MGLKWEWEIRRHHSKDHPATKPKKYRPPQLADGHWICICLVKGSYWPFPAPNQLSPQTTTQPKMWTSRVILGESNFQREALESMAGGVAVPLVSPNQLTQSHNRASHPIHTTDKRGSG
ncbi:hypothetical protein Ddc_04412 [Ditylenchus destructor]|nr:hypothetical protein Ddc_04412 [Ditylenchus destructor]